MNNPGDATDRSTTRRSSSTLGHVKQLVAGLREISGVADIIEQVAFKTNLLALNAAIEAAHAGDKGRGFAVVAGEVRRLAGQTTAATNDINKVLDAIKDESHLAIQNVEDSERHTIQQSAATFLANETSRMNSRFLAISTSLYGLKHFIQALRKKKMSPSREQIDVVMQEYLAQNKDLLAFSCGLEPNAIDERDSEFADKPGYDKTGRFMPYWYRASGRIVRECLVDYDTPGLDDYYELPRKTGRETFMEPYDYMVAGKPILITSLMLPLLENGRFFGVLGADYTLQQLQDELLNNHPFGIGQYILLSNAGRFVAHPEKQQVGKQADSFPSAAIAAIKSGKAHQFVDDNGVQYLFSPLTIGNSDTPWSLCLRFDINAVLGNL